MGDSTTKAIGVGFTAASGPSGKAITRPPTESLVVTTVLELGNTHCLLAEEERSPLDRSKAHRFGGRRAEYGTFEFIIENQGWARSERILGAHC